MNLATHNDTFAERAVTLGAKACKTARLGGNRDAVRSYGMAMRINVLGFAVAEIEYVRR